MSRKEYKGIKNLPTGRASDNITEGCMVLEGGGWRGVYTVGVLDALMERDINLSATVGISAGGLCGLGYTTG
ncbi:MAG: patatin family protein, partial [Lachnospiraceae bacterium]|nr:patatin family protein [Lachnospiraceae bacterium]